MQLIDGRVIYAASDLTNYLECDHLVGLEYAAAVGDIVPLGQPTDAELAARYGRLHEQQLYQDLRERGNRVVEIPASYGLDDITAAAETTLRHMRDGAPYIAQATFFDGGWLGHADLLVKIDRPSELGAWSYEVLDAKLARRVKPYAIVQVCFYSDQLARLQGPAPECVRLYLGTGLEERLRLADFIAYYRRIKSRFEALVAERTFDSYPEPVSHCAICRWNARCEARRVADDHLSLVAEIRRDQIVKLNAGGIATTAALAAAATSPARLADATFKKLRHQAELHVRGRESGFDQYDLLPPEELRGLGRLPKPSAGDVFFDMEGHPYVDGGLEYLFGVAWRDEESGELRYRAFWAHNHAEERRALQEFVQFIDERRTRFADLHVYHYAHYEPAALKRLMTQRGTCEDEIDTWLRAELFVDLYQVVHQGLRSSRPGYGLKEMEHLYGFERVGEVAEAMQSVRTYEEYLATGDRRRLDEIESYNRQDCVSTMELRGWLLARRDEAAQRFARDIPFLAPPEQRPVATDKIVQAGELQSLKSALRDGIPEDSQGATPEQRARWLMSQLLDYHRREAKPVWWAYFDRLGKDPHDLVEDSDSIGDLSPDRAVPPRPDKRSLVYTLTFPAQQHRLDSGDAVFDPATEKAGSIERIDEAAGRLELRRSNALAKEALPRALIPGGPIRSDQQEGALQRLARAIIDDDAHKYRALRDILSRSFPRARGVRLGDPLQGETFDLDAAKQLVADLDESYLFIQGPPGSGKTYNGARLAVALMKQGKRVGVASNSHKAINNLLAEIENVAHDERFVFCGLKKSSGIETEYHSKHARPSIANTSSNDDFPGSDAIRLIAGTAWLFSRADLDGRLDYLFVDEAGQVSLADALAMGTSARNIVLLGDPLQLSQVSLAAHPDGAGASVLEHLLGDSPTIPPERGVFLEHTRRLHPAICEFIAEIVYAGRLQSASACRLRSVASPGLRGAGLRYIPVEHSGNAQQSAEEAAAVAEAAQALLRGTFTDEKGALRKLSPADILVVTPYNMQVRCLKDALRTRDLVDVRVGTVDKFQGQEAAVVFYSLATSSGEDLPRNLEFLFSRNRLNVAISRAQCLAILVASPRLLDIGCKTVDQLQMVNALCRLVELAAPSDTRASFHALERPASADRRDPVA